MVTTSPCEFVTFRILKLAHALDFDDKCAPPPPQRLKLCCYHGWNLEAVVYTTGNRSCSDFV